MLCKDIVWHLRHLKFLTFMALLHKKVRDPMHHYVYINLFLKQLNIFQAIDCGAWGKKVQPSSLMFAHGFPHHLAGEMFYCTDHVLRIEFLAFWSSNVPLPHCKLLNCRLVKK